MNQSEFEKMHRLVWNEKLYQNNWREVVKHNLTSIKRKRKHKANIIFAPAQHGPSHSFDSSSSLLFRHTNVLIFMFINLRM